MSNARFNAEFAIWMLCCRYPLVWNRPSESEEELAEFVQAIEHLHGIPQAEILALLRVYSSLQMTRNPGPFLTTIRSDVTNPVHEHETSLPVPAAEPITQSGADG